MRRRVRLEPSRMSELQLWGFLHTALCALDPLDLSYAPGQAHHVSLNAQDALRQLRLRGVQLALPLTQPDHSTDEVA